MFRGMLPFILLPLIMSMAHANAGEYDGIYRPDLPDSSGWSCKKSDIGMDGGALAIQDGYIDGLENRCRLTLPKPNSENSGTEFTSVCSGEGEEYTQTITLRHVDKGISLTTNGTTVNWISCSQSSEPTHLPEGGIWKFANGIASIISEGNYLGFSCETFNPSSTFPVANLVGPCPACMSGDNANFSFVVDGGQAQVFLFERQSNAEGWKSSLDYYPNWYSGLVSDLIGGNSLSIYEGNTLSASFPLKGSSKALKQLRLNCN